MMIVCACGSVGPLVALRNGFSVTSIGSAVSSGFLGFMASHEIIYTTKRLEGKRRHLLYKRNVLETVIMTVFTAAVSHLLLNTFSLGKAACAQVGLAVLPLNFFLRKIGGLLSETKNRNPLRYALELSGRVFICSSISLAAVAVFKHFAMISIPEGPKSLIFTTTLLATGASMVASAVATFFVSYEGRSSKKHTV